MARDELKRIIGDVPRRVVARYRARAASDEDATRVVTDTLYHEQRRLERSSRRHRRADPGEQRLFAQLVRRLDRASAAQHWGLVERLAQHFIAEVVGPSSERAYRVAARGAPLLLGALLRLRQPRALLRPARLLDGVAPWLQLQGELARVQALARRGTLLVVPTHLSNLDPVLMGYALAQLGLGRPLFGGSAHLFSNPLVAFLFHTLGAYRVDRERGSRLYKDVLKEYATWTLCAGRHNIFFPGGTRSRGGAVEQRLKKGLLGTGLTAYLDNLREGRARPDVFIAPVTIGYKLVLEAETLIDDQLKEQGQARYIIDDDEFTQPARLARYFAELAALGDRIVIHFAAPLDVFGNVVTDDGTSLDCRGRPIDPRRYLTVAGEPRADLQRDMQYTNELAEAIAQAYHRERVVASTHVVARALLNLLRRRNPALDVFRLLHGGGVQPSFPLAELCAEVERELSALGEDARGPRRGPDLLALREASAVVDDALVHFAAYHRRPAARRRGDRVFHEHRALLLYYANRVRPEPLSAR